MRFDKVQSEPKGFQPAKVVVTIQTQEELDAIAAFNEDVSYDDIRGLDNNTGQVIVDLVDGIFNQVIRFM